MQRALSEFLSVVRRSGLRVAEADALCALRAAEVLGLEDRELFRLGLRSVLAKSEGDQRHFDRAFEAYFSARGGARQDLRERLLAQGFSEDEVRGALQVLRAAGNARQGSPVLAALARGDADLDQLIHAAAIALGIDRSGALASLGASTVRVLDATRFGRAQAQLPALRSQLRDAFGTRGDALTDALARELSAVRERTRQGLGTLLTASAQVGDVSQVPFEQLDPAEVLQVERAVRLLSRQLIGRVRRAQAAPRRGRLDGSRTLRRALQTGAVPFEPIWRRRRPPRRRLLLLCDVSESVRQSVGFMLLFMHTLQRVFPNANSLVFVSDVCDATLVFRREPARRAVELSLGGALVDVTPVSHYGRALEQLRSRHAHLLSRRTSLVILGDGRSSHQPPRAEVLAAIRARIGRVVWLVPEPRGRWFQQDSDLAAYAPHTDGMWPVYNLASLREASRKLSG